jgi:hypothetical protein
MGAGSGTGYCAAAHMAHGIAELFEPPSLPRKRFCTLYLFVYGAEIFSFHRSPTFGEARRLDVPS